jgi:hypothetical protein
MTQQNRELVEGLYEAFFRGDLDGVLARCDENVVWRTPGATLPTAGVRYGRDEVREFFELLGTLFDFRDLKVETLLADGDRVVVLGSETVIMKGTGAPIPISWAHVFTIRYGKIAAFTEYKDTASIAAEYHRGALRA